MSCKSLSVPDNEIKVAFVTEGLCKGEEERGLWEKNPAVFISPKFVKTNFIKWSSFSGIHLVLLYYNYQKQGFLSL